MAVGALMTADEYLALPEDGPRTELVEGEVVLVEPDLLHQLVCGDLLFAFQTWTRAASRGGLVVLPIDVKLNERNVYNPDILWYAEDRAPARSDARPYAMPSIAIEIRSPSTWRYDVGVKKRIYEERGLPELWLIDTRTPCVLVFRRSTAESAPFDVALELERDEQLTSPQLPGFSLALRGLFED